MPGIRVKLSRAPSSSQVVGFEPRGEDIHQAAIEGNVSAMRHFLRVDPESLERKGGLGGRGLGTDVGSYETDPSLPYAWYVW